MRLISNQASPLLRSGAPTSAIIQVCPTSSLPFEPSKSTRKRRKGVTTAQLGSRTSFTLPLVFPQPLRTVRQQFAHLVTGHGQQVNTPLLASGRAGNGVLHGVLEGFRAQDQTTSTTVMGNRDKATGSNSRYDATHFLPAGLKEFSSEDS